MNCNNVQRLKLRPAGMFSNVNEVVEQLRLAERGGYQFVIDWANSCYRDPDYPGDPWAYYFAPCFDGLHPDAATLANAPVLPGGVPVACSRDNIITPRLRDGDCTPLLLPKDRQGAHDIICRYIRINQDIADHIDAFAALNFTAKKVIGLHIRGPGRNHGGAAELRQQHDAVGGVPFAPYFEKVDQALKSDPNAQIFACSDSSTVIDTVCKEYGSRVVTYHATRSPFGEMHANHPENKGQTFPPHKLGLDVLVEAYLLAQTALFIHGNTNVANFVLCKAPELEHVFVSA